MRFLFYFSFNNQGNGFKSLGATFFLGLRFDMRAACLLVLPMFILGQFSKLDPFKSSRARKAWMVYWVICMLGLVLFYEIDIAHYAYLSQRLNASALNYLQDAGISKNMIWESYPVIRLLLLFLIVTFLMIWVIRLGFRFINRNATVTKRINRFIEFPILFLSILILVFGKINQYPMRWSDAFGLGNDYKANLALNPFESFFNTLKFRNISYDEKKVKELFPVLAKYYGVDSSSLLNFTRRVTVPDSMQIVKPNIVLIICESFSAYKSSLWGNPLNTTPFFDSLSKKGLFFDRCFTPSYGTARGVWASLTGITDVELPNTSSRNPLAVDQHLILNDFNGYEKYYFIGGSPSWANIRGLLMNNINGLHLYDEESLDAPRLDVWGVSDKNLLLESNKILAKESNPFFAVIQTADNHRPYTIPVEDSGFVVRTTTEDSLDRFGFMDQLSYNLKLKEYNAFRYSDYTFQQFMKAAEKEKYFTNTVFVFIGDHGIAGDAGNMFSRAWTEQRLTAEHVPLLFFYPGKIEAKRSSVICSQVDLMPTIAGISSISYTNSALGRNLLDSPAYIPFAFIFDPDQRQSGVIMGDQFYRKQLLTGKEELVSIRNKNQTDTFASVSYSKEEMKLLNEAVYQASRYLLFNNKKKTKVVN
ncbi:MAG: LTA synthase family protein [Chitinophagaceae bacterium]